MLYECSGGLVERYLSFWRCANTTVTFPCTVMCDPRTAPLYCRRHQSKPKPIGVGGAVVVKDETKTVKSAADILLSLASS